MIGGFQVGAFTRAFQQALASIVEPIFWGKSPLKSRKKLREEELAREQEEREFLGILPKAQKIIKREVAKELKKPNGNYESLLAAFAKAEIQYKIEYQRLYLQELRRQEEEQEDEEIALLLMM